MHELVRRDCDGDEGGGINSFSLEGVADDPPCPSVLHTTPTIIPPSDATSSGPNLSTPQKTAVAAEVIGSAAFTVSTNAADPVLNPIFVKTNPIVKYIEDSSS